MLRNSEAVLVGNFLLLTYYGRDEHEIFAGRLILYGFDLQILNNVYSKSCTILVART